ncbi:hypothetical protein SANT12839_036570 [Streptomyces antimycoticus]|uniref:GH84 domain-containing protein n=1 Tax=Streptomyces antimycoticus TaxID=68175 RepID=A0A4D4K1G0_9ACTN|nr:hypothetical protein SANT12839_036570 [Streptomyces antimycoticus]
MDHGSPGASTPERDSSDGIPPVWPRPQSLRAHGPELALGDEATLIADGDADPYALDALRGLLHDAGVRTVNEATPGGKAPTRGLVVRVGGRGAAGALRALRAPERGDLPSGGYLLATGPVEGRPTIALSGVGPDGLFHAVQTLRQLLVKPEGKGSAVAGVTVRDWPGTAVRGTTEGFYGSPWSHRDRLAQLDFMGRTKQNRYLYAPGDDPYRQARWRDPYPAERREEFRELATRARANHVTLGWAVSPARRCASRPRRTSRRCCARSTPCGRSGCAPSSCSSRTSATASGTATPTPTPSAPARRPPPPHRPRWQAPSPAIWPAATPARPRCP